MGFVEVYQTTCGSPKQKARFIGGDKTDFNHGEEINLIVDLKLGKVR